MILQKESSSGRALVAVRNNNGNKGKGSRKGKVGESREKGGSGRGGVFGVEKERTLWRTARRRSNLLLIKEQPP